MPYKNKEDQAKAQARYRLKILAVVEEARQTGCLDCGENDPIVLVFHHRNPEEKSFSIGRATGTMSVSRLMQELEKCDVLCANCHLRRHRTNNLEG